MQPNALVPAGAHPADVAFQKNLERLRPRSFEDVVMIADRLAGSSLLPNELRERQSLFLIILLADDLGLSVAQAIRGVSVIKGKPVMGAQLMVAVCLRHTDVCAYFRPVEFTESKAMYETKRVGTDKPVQASFTIAEAERAGLIKPDSNWAKWPAEMLRARASSRLARMVYPDLLFGMHAREEVEDGTVDMVETTPGSYAPPPLAAAQASTKQAPPPATAKAPAAAEPAKTAVAGPDFRERIAAAATRRDLEALVPEIQRLSAEERTALRPVYEARKALIIGAEVISGPPPGQTPPPAAPPAAEPPPAEREPGSDDGE